MSKMSLENRTSKIKSLPQEFTSKGIVRRSLKSGFLGDIQAAMKTTKEIIWSKSWSIPIMPLLYLECSADRPGSYSTTETPKKY